METDIGAYFALLQYALMAATFVAIVLIFLYIYYGQDEDRYTDVRATGVNKVRLSVSGAAI